jgi:predicted nuclease of predicted toxin-antitoxin system
VSVALYMDVHVRRAVTMALRERGVNVLTAQADGATELSDPELLDRATALGRVLFSQDEDLLVEATLRQRQGIPFSGVIYAHQLYLTIGQCVSDLEFIAKVANPEDLLGRVEFLPL